MKLYFNGPKSIFRQVESIKGYAFPDPEISFSSSFETTVRMNRTKFGDGYEQRSLDGINNTPLVLNFTFTNRSLEVILEIKKFLEGSDVVYNRTPDEFFYYIPPAPFDGGNIPTYRKFVCDKWTLDATQSNNYTINGIWNEVFDPA
jgi:phage-related protein